MHFASFQAGKHVHLFFFKYIIIIVCNYSHVPNAATSKDELSSVAPIDKVVGDCM